MSEISGSRTSGRDTPEVCPECGGDGSRARMFDGNCPCEWAHRFIFNRRAPSSYVYNYDDENPTIEARSSSSSAGPGVEPRLSEEEARGLINAFDRAVRSHERSNTMPMSVAEANHRLTVTQQTGAALLRALTKGSRE